ncbi:MAG: hypothetical protein V4670_03165 [Bacteroidota bacterium]
MKTEHLTEKLGNAIAILEKKQKVSLFELKSECNDVLNEMKPMNIMNQVINSFSPESSIKAGLFRTALTLGVNYFSRKVAQKKSNPILNKIIELVTNLKFA